MIKQLTAFTVNLIAGANAATVLVMLLVGYSYLLDPTRFPILSTVGIAFPIVLAVNLGFLVFWMLFKWRKAWIPLAGFICAYVPINIYLPLNTPREVPEDALKIVSWNVCMYGGNYKYTEGFDTVWGYLNRQQPDIVCIQEDVDTWRRYVFQRYEKLFAYNDTTSIFCPNGDVNGIGMHTKFPILKKERLDYPSVGNGSVAFYLKVRDDTVLVVVNHLETTHLTSTERDRYSEIIHGKVPREKARNESKLMLETLARSNTIRATQAKVVHDYIAKHSQYPTIVCGDFNDTPISYSRYHISQGLTDCYRETGFGLGLSFNRKDFPVRIDHMFCSTHFEPYNCKIDNKIDASDHYPVICWLKKRDIH